MKVIVRSPDKGYVDNWLWVPKGYVDEDGVKRALTHEIVSYGGGTKLIYLYRESVNHMLLPRAFWPVGQLPFPVIDCRPRKYEEVNFRSKILLDHLPQVTDAGVQLRPTGKDVQQQSMNALESNPSGILQLACGKGKTVVALDRIARGRAPAIVMLDNTTLLHQWRQEAEKLLDIPGGVGIIGEGKKDWKKALVLATYHSIANWADEMPEEVRRWFSQAFWDEGHHVSAPTFAKTADVFYGNRFSLTATPDRDDGMHVIARAHIGEVLYKDLTPMMHPMFAFLWTGLSLDLRDPTVAEEVLDTNGEVHTSKVYSFFGKWDARLNIIINACRAAVAAGRKVLVLSNSVGEVVNLYTKWVYGSNADGRLYTDIPAPSPADVGETLNPMDLTKGDIRKLNKEKAALEKQLKKAGDDTQEAVVIQAGINQVNQLLHQHKVHQKITAHMTKQQKKYIGKLLEHETDAGFLVYDVPSNLRQKFVEDKKITFAITKYGKEGLNSQALDTIIVSSLFSSANGLQQLMGRPTRPYPGKKTPLIIAIVDNAGQCIGMSQKLQKHLRGWPRDEGGPYEPIFVEYPATWTYRKKTAALQDLLLR